jgi:putative oxidoreductase
MIDASVLTLGAQAPDAALTLNRVALGLFFMISGYHKLFTASRHATLKGTLQEAGVPALAVMQWFVPGVEFSAGCALILGMLSALAAFGLFVICLTAIALDAIKRIQAWQPIDRADWLGDLLYLPETLYCIGLAIVMLAGPGPWSVDAALHARLPT